MEIDKALFDFDEEIDNLEDIADRYPITQHSGKKEILKAKEELEEPKEKKVMPPPPKLDVKRPERPVGLGADVLADLEKMKSFMNNHK